jgi:hypothetical protein
VPNFRARNCDFRQRGAWGEICAAEDEKSDIDWF